MVPLTLTFDIPAKILTGIADGSLVRNGGVIQNASGQVVMWLREVGTPLVLPSVSSVGAMSSVSSVMLSASVLSLGVSVLSLSVSAIGFAVILQRLKELEGRLEKVQKYLEKIDKKIDLSFYANFRAALDLAMNAFTMSKGENRRSSALSAINRFLEAEHIYTDLTDKELATNSQIGDEYLLTLCLTYIAEARCYLELGEFDTAIRRFQEGKQQIRVRIEKYIDLLLTSKPLMYLHPKLKDKTDLSRLAKIYQWKDPVLTESSVFELIRDGLAPQRDMWWSYHINEWIDSLPTSIVERKNIKTGIRGITEEGREEIIQNLPETLTEMESMIETSQRFNAYEIEVRAISNLGISFSEWLQLQPSEFKEGEKDLMCIIPQEPLGLR